MAVAVVVDLAGDTVEQPWCVKVHHQPERG